MVHDFSFFCRMVSIQIVLDMNKMQLLPLPFLRNIQGTGPQVKLYNHAAFKLCYHRKNQDGIVFKKKCEGQKKN